MSRGSVEEKGRRERQRLATRILPRLDYGERPTDCWRWTAYVDRDGYGRVHMGRGMALAHRVVYELLVEEIPAGLTIDHLCRVRDCVNPLHLEVVSMTENILRGESPPAHNARKVECIHGHALSPANTYYKPNGRRECRTCRREAMRAWHARTR